jgi:NADPH:quinone reductase-like Zn-dependent oxidoreductase
MVCRREGWSWWGDFLVDLTNGSHGRRMDMKAFHMTRYGGPEVMQLGDVPVPTPGRGQLLIAVRASSVNPIDYKIREGQMKFATGWRFPKVLGADFAGEVCAFGPGAKDFSVGDLVYGSSPPLLHRQGAHGEYLCVAAKHARLVPEGVTLEQAAAMPVAALTAVDGLGQCGPIAGKRVAVNGATGGVGHFAVQMAKAKGAHVTAVCSAANAERARALGADEVLDYRQTDLASSGKRFDVIFDASGKLGALEATPMLEDKGIYITTLPFPPVLARALWRRVIGGKQIVLANARDRARSYEELESLIRDGAVHPVVEHVFPLDQAAEAFARLESGGTVGKVVIRVRTSPAPTC